MMVPSWCHMQFCYRTYGLKLYKSSCFYALSTPTQHYLGRSYSSRKQSTEQAVYASVTATGDKKDVSSPLPSAYSPEFVETAWYDWWEKQGFFKPETPTEPRRSTKPPFVMVLPPPNVTGTLHLGHAITNSIQDAIVRWHRMKGREVFWVPGCDHAGIATQVVVERKLWQEQRKTRHDLGREKFVEEVWKWKHQKGEIIYDQMKKLGSSLDWDRACFTMDEKLSHAVVEAFVRLHDDGLIYRNNRLVNWSCALRSAISDIEVDNIPVEGRTLLPVPGYDRKVPFGVLTSFAYPVHGTDQEIVVSTTRLETMLGDVAVAIHPDDHRYKHLHGQHVVHPISGKHLPIVCDTFVDMEFGTGAVKVTPGHDHTDFEVGERHGLPKPNIIDDNGNMVNVSDPFRGMRRFEARRHVAKTLKEKSLYRGEQDHVMSVPICSRSQDIVEPRLKEQWFVDCQDMAKKAIDAVESGRLKLFPSWHEKIWLDWLQEIRDWCVSRQLLWGHRIPAFQVTNVGGDIWVSGRSEEEARRKAAEKLGMAEDQITLKQDDDVLDTWFSSALFPFSVMGWPEQSSDFSRFYPTSLLETGSDILFFWVARMVMMGEKLTGQLPFSEVLLHGILRDSQGRKMSKSLGNVIDPMDVIHGRTLEELHGQLANSNLDPAEVKRAREGQKKDYPQGIPQCGADALRFTLCSYDFKASEINMDITHARSNRHFCNKLWQAYRFMQSNLGDNFKPMERFQLCESHSATDLWILSRLSHMIKSCDVHFKAYDLHLATKALHQFWLTEFCDIYLECVKPVFQYGSTPEQGRAREVLYLCMETFLRAITPFMPYLSEELFQRLPPKGDNWPVSVCVAEYPHLDNYPWQDNHIEQTMSVVKDIGHQCLSVRKEFNLTKTRASTFLLCTDHNQTSELSKFHTSLQILSRAKDFRLVSDKQSLPDGCLHMHISDTCQLAVLLKDIIDPHKEQPKLVQKLGKLETDLHRLSSNCQNSSDDQAVRKMTDKTEILKAQIKRTKNIISVVESLR